ncbi:MAG: hypothetical protein NZ480_04855 [Bdellovibrionaceae bacterium]|nr:hypothetical protein [Pseudobdellovibrionaceae bacterium]MDW8189732.1 hypothetical protein [Pseudobdellovibrionaceae bacterium]
MTIEIATAQQNAELTAFFEQFEFEDLIKFKIKRPHGFFAPYQFLGFPFETLILRGKKGECLACVTFLYPQLFHPINKQPIKMALAIDLRVLPTRQATLGWHQNFVPVLEDIKSRHHIQYFVSLLSRSDRKVLNTFLRAHPFRREVPRYHLYQNMELVSVHGFLPMSQIRLKNVEARPAHEQDWEAIDVFLQKLPKKNLEDIFSSQDLKRKLEHYQLSLKHLWVARSLKSGEVFGFLVQFPARKTQDYIPLSYQMRAHNFRQFLKFGNLFNWTHKLTKPKSRTAQELPLEFDHLIHIHVQHADIFQMLLQSIWRTLGPYHFLVYLRNNLDYHLNLGRGIIHASLPYDLFLIQLPRETSFEISFSHLAIPIHSHLCF